MAPHSPSADSSPSQEPPPATAEVELQVGDAREQKLASFSNFLQSSATSTVVVCLASVAVTLVIMAALGIRAFIECPKQISELAQRLIMANSDFAKVLSECYEESSDLKRQLRNATFNLIATINEVKDLRKMAEEYAKMIVHLKEKLCLIHHMNISQNCTNLWEKAIQDLHSYDPAEARTEEKPLRLLEVADNCTDWSKQLQKENLDLQTIYDSHVTQQSTNSPHSKNVSTLRTRIQYMRDFMDDCLKALRDKNLRLQTINTCCIKDLKEESGKLQTMNGSYAALLDEVDQLQDMKEAIRSYLKLKQENQELKELVGNQTEVGNEIRNCTQNCQALRTVANRFSSVWDHCDYETLQCSPCRANWVSHSSSCFLLSTDSQSWLAAQAQCVRLGGDLATVSSHSQWTFLTTLISPHRSAWIGLTDLIVEQVFQWVNATVVSGGHWANNTWENDCVALVSSAKNGEENWTPVWTVFNCTDTRPYICETAAFNHHPTT